MKKIILSLVALITAAYMLMSNKMSNSHIPKNAEWRLTSYTFLLPIEAGRHDVFSVTLGLNKKGAVIKKWGLAKKNEPTVVGFSFDAVNLCWYYEINGENGGKRYYLQRSTNAVPISDHESPWVGKYELTSICENGELEKTNYAVIHTSEVRSGLIGSIWLLVTLAR